MKNAVIKINMGSYPNNCTTYLAPYLILLSNLYNDIFASIGHVIMCLRIAPCERVIYVCFVFLWVSIDSGVEGLSNYPDEQFFTTGQQGKR